MRFGPRVSKTGIPAIAIAAALVVARPPAAEALDCTNTNLDAAIELVGRILGAAAPGDEVDFSGDGFFNVGDIVVQLLVGTEQTMLPPTCEVLGACGDGIVQGGRGEGCDDGNLLNEDGCDAQCTAEFCGDAVVQAGLGELCDDGNMAGGDGCDAACATEVCGNGVLQGLLGELCDDGNLDGGDGCDGECATEVCGNGVLQEALGETCDDGNTDAGDGCDGNCQVETACGNGVLDEGEECDDGNDTAGDGCDAACITEVCGNGVVQTGETCDDGNTADGDGCDASCQTEDEPQELLTTRDVCLNVADGPQTFRIQLFDRTLPDAQFILVPDANPPVGPSAEVSMSPDGVFSATIDGPEDVGDYAFALASTAARFDIFNMKVVNDPAPQAFPAATRPFLLGMVPTQGRYDYTFSDGAGINLPHPAGAAAVLQSLGAAELQLIQTFPEWALPYSSLEDAPGTLRRAAQNLRGTGRDVIFSLDIFGSGFRDRITLPTDDAAEICAACGLGVPDASGTLCTGGAVDFSCETLRTRLGDYAEAVAETIAPPYMTIGVEMDLYEFSRPGDYANFAAAFKAAAQRVKAVSPTTKVFVTIQYEGMLVLEVLTNPFFANKDQLIRNKVARVLNPLAPDNELYVITTFPEILRAADLGRDGNPNLDIPIEDWNDPADMPDDYYKYVTDFLGQPGYPEAAAALESGWSTQDVDTMTCEDLAFFPLTRASALNADDGIGDPAVTFRSEAGQVRAFHRMIELMYEQLHPEFLIWFYARNPTQLGTTPVLPIFQTMGLREDIYEFNGGCVGVPDQPLNESKVTVVGERSKDALCDWLRLFHLPYAP